MVFLIEINGVYFTANHFGLFALMGSMLLAMIVGGIWLGIDEYKTAKAKKREEEGKQE